jgi:tetratricopeptide (TPR) repeat protein
VKNRRYVVYVSLLCLCILPGCSRNPEITKRRYLESGQQYAQKGKYEEARIQFTRAIKLDARFVDAYYQLGLSDVALHDWNGAFRALEQAQALDPSRSDVQLEIGQLYLAASNFELANGAASALLQANPSNTSAYRLLGDALLAKNDQSGALEAFSKLLQLAPEEPVAHENMGLLEAKLQRYAEAEQHLRKAIEIDPRFVQGYLNLASFYRSRNQSLAADEVLQKGIDFNADAVSLYLSHADLWDSEGKKDLAEQELQRLRDRKKGSAEVSLAVGDYYSQHGELEAACQEYLHGLSGEPTNIDLKNQTVEAYLESGRTAEAAALNESVLKDKPKDATAQVQRGRILLASGNVQAAITQLRDQVADAPDSPQVHYALGLAYARDRSFDMAQSEFGAALKLSPGMLPVIESMASMQLARKQPALAKEYAQRCVEEVPGNPTCHLLLGMVLFDSDTGAAIEQFQIASKLAPKDPVAHLQLAAAYSREKKWQEAGNQFQDALRISPRNHQALEQYANYLAVRNERAKAITRVQQFLADYPDDPGATLLLGSLYAGAKQYGDAKIQAERAVQLDPKLVAAYLDLGKLEQALGNRDAAIRNYEKALSLQPNVVPLLTLVGNLYLDKSDLVSARKYYDRALAIDSDFAPALANLAYLQAKQGGELNVALGLAQKAKSLLPDLDAITDTLAWIEYLKGEYGEAVPAFQECVRKDPSMAIYRYHLGMALLARGDKKGAKSALEVALKLNLAGDDAQKARETLAHTAAN